MDYSAASTPVPSDSFPGMTAQVTGGNPGTTGVYYDDTYNHGLLPAGTTACDGSVPLGAEVDLTEDLDWNKNSIDAGQGLTGLPNSILNLTGNAKALINPAKLPVDPKTCKPVYPNSYLQVNTVFNVVANAGLRTAWSDKHAAYDILSGPQGNGIQDLFTPEINSQYDQQPGPGAGRRPGLDHGQRRDPAVRRLQGPGRPERDRRLRPQRQDQGRHPGGLRPELPVRLHRGEAADLRRPGRRLPRRRPDPRPAAVRLAGLRQRRGRPVHRRAQEGRPGRRAPRSSCRPSTASPRRTRPR